MFLWWSSLHNTNVKGTNTFDTRRSLELDVDVSSWLKMKARHWWSLQVPSPYTMCEALLCIHLHLSIMWSSTSFKHVILWDGYLELTLVNHDHQHLMSSSHRHLKSLSRCEPMRISSQKHRQHIVWVSTQSAIDKFLPYHKISRGTWFVLVCWPSLNSIFNLHVGQHLSLLHD